ncbi:MAG TPA: site-2 protease family protein [Methanothermococcus okinawensis]|uniref:Site-2 protease family protein n=1 Tax=Methanothermococcus okinawensis TaxID=155863 RepID=A0A832ZJ55_9EURY|nr:site-2 protease family protein [Methanococcaceae archaeon]HIP84508.1 site-2 protease family protein [Methanothermococcus okinawensis]HIP91081.1 site-2 protease family protein [Methanothermococcus okinawensis]
MNYDLFHFSPREIRDLIISTVAIALIFAWPGRGFYIFEDPTFLPRFIISLFIVGSGFIFHELAHRTVARYFGAYSEFRAWFEGLILALILKILVGFTFIAPGAVYIFKDYLTPEESGLIALAGPLSNVLLAILFYVFSISLPPFSILSLILYLGVYINLYLAAFNLLPIPPFDGSKVLSWNPVIWAVVSLPLFYWVFF